MAPVLQLPNVDRDFVLKCDTSVFGMGPVLHQGDGPVAFFSRQITLRHAKLAAYKWELIGLVQVVRHLRAYLWGRAFFVKIYHYNLKYQLTWRPSRSISV
jgi:hypothetical protein